MVEKNRDIKNFLEESYLKRKTRQENENYPSGLHIVLESSPNSYYYFVDFIEDIKESLIEYHENICLDCIEDKDHKGNIFQITSISGSGLNALSMFMYASGLKMNLMRKKLSEMVRKIKYDGGWTK